MNADKDRMIMLTSGYSYALTSAAKTTHFSNVYASLKAKRYYISQIDIDVMLTVPTGELVPVTDYSSIISVKEFSSYIKNLSFNGGVVNEVMLKTGQNFFSQPLIIETRPTLEDRLLQFSHDIAVVPASYVAGSEYAFKFTVYGAAEF